MALMSLKAQARKSNVSAKAVRHGGSVPCVVYGSVKENLLVECKALELHQTFVKAGESTLVELDVDGKKIPVLFKDMAFDPVSGREIHADFYAVDMRKAIETLVPIHLEGEAPAVKDHGGVLVTPNLHVRVRCLPADLPKELLVNIAVLAEFHDSIMVKDLTLPKGVTVIDQPMTVLVTVQEPRKEEEIAPPTPVAAEGAVPAEGTPAAEGAAPAEDAAPAAEGAAPAKAEKKEKK